MHLDLAIHVIHGQKINLFVQQDKDGYAIPRTGKIDKSTPSILLLSTPALNFKTFSEKDHGFADNSDEAQTRINAFYEHLFTVTEQMGYAYITLPAAGLGAFKGEPSVYHKAILLAAENHPNLNIIYNPNPGNQGKRLGAEIDKEFEALAEKRGLSNIMSTDKDVMYLADALTKNGKPCAYHNPSDADVVYGLYDIGEYWKQGHYAGEEDIASKSTAVLNSRLLNHLVYRFPTSGNCKEHTQKLSQLRTLMCAFRAMHSYADHLLNSKKWNMLMKADHKAVFDSILKEDFSLPKDGDIDQVLRAMAAKFKTLNNTMLEQLDKGSEKSSFKILSKTAL